MTRPKKKQLTESDVARFVRACGRKKQKRSEPNDRGFDRSVEEKIKQLDPKELDRLLREDDVD